MPTVVLCTGSAAAKAEAHAMMLALIGEKTPSYIAAPALAVGKSNLLESYQTVFDSTAPAELSGAYGKLSGCA